MIEHPYDLIDEVIHLSIYLVEEVPINSEDKDHQMALALQRQMDLREQRQHAPQVKKNFLGKILSWRFPSHYTCTTNDLLEIF